MKAPKVLMAAVACSAAMLLTSVSALAVTDPAGDAHTPTFDLVDATFEGPGTSVEAKAFFAVNSDTSTWVDGYDALEWLIDTNGDGAENYVLRVTRSSLSMRDTNGNFFGTECGLVPGVLQLGTMLRVALTTACFGSPSSYRWQAVMGHYDPVTAAFISEDRVPNSGWSPLVTVAGSPGGGGGNPVGGNYAVTTLTPARLVDTRSLNSTVDGAGAGGGVLPAGGTITVQASGRGGVPAGAVGAVVNVTAVEPSAAGFMTLYPCGTQRPLASNLNFRAGQTVANAAVVKLSSAGTLCLYSHVPTQVVLDVTGYVPVGSGLVTTVPARLVDTRAANLTVDGISSGSGAVAAGSVLSTQVAGRGGVPLGADTVVVNLTSVEPSAAGFMTLFPCDVPRPTTSNVNFAAGFTAASSAVVKLSSAGKLCVYSHVAAHVVLDVSAHATAADGLTTLTPGRLVDTRTVNSTIDGASSGAGRLAGGSTYRFQVAGRGGVAPTAVGAMLSVVAVEAGAAGFATVYPCGSRPTASTLNFTSGSTVANSAVAQLAADGTVCVYVHSNTQLVVDVTGYLD